MVTDSDRAVFLRTLDKTLRLATKMKKVMMKKGLRRARAECPDCPGKWLNGTIHGNRDHLHMQCDCRKYSMME